MKRVLLSALIATSMFAMDLHAATISRNVGVSYNLDTLDTKLGLVTSSSASFFELVTTTNLQLSLYQFINSSVITLYSDTNTSLNKVTFNDLAGTTITLDSANKFGSFALLPGQYVLKLNATPLSSIGVTIAAVPLPATAWLFSSVVLGSGLLRRKMAQTK